MQTPCIRSPFARLNTNLCDHSFKTLTSLQMVLTCTPNMWDLVISSWKGLYREIENTLLVSV